MTPHVRKGQCVLRMSRKTFPSGNDVQANSTHSLFPMVTILQFSSSFISFLLVLDLKSLTTQGKELCCSCQKPVQLFLKPLLPDPPLPFSHFHSAVLSSITLTAKENLLIFKLLFNKGHTFLQFIFLKLNSPLLALLRFKLSQTEVANLPIPSKISKLFLNTIRYVRLVSAH